jgi:hypothetical protein
MISYPNKLYHLCLLLIFFNTNIYASDIIVFSDSLRARYIGKEVSFLEDLSDSLKIEYIANYGQFQHSDHDNLYFGMSSSAFWIKFSIQNRLEKDIFLKLENPLIDFADLYTPNPDGKFEIQRTGEAYPFHSRQYKSEFFLFKLKKDSKIQTYYLRVKSSLLSYLFP